MYFKDHFGHGVLHGELYGAMSIGAVRYACREQQVELPFGGGIADNRSARGIEGSGLRYPYLVVDVAGNGGGMGRVSEE